MGLLLGLTNPWFHMPPVLDHYTGFEMTHLRKQENTDVDKRWLICMYVFFFFFHKSTHGKTVVVCLNPFFFLERKKSTFSKGNSGSPVLTGLFDQ